MIHTISFRRAICCVMICLVLMLCCEPCITARAAAVATFAEVAVESVIAIGSIVTGLGVLRDPEKNAFFDTLVDNVVSHFSLNKTMQVVGWVSSGFQRYAVSQSLIEDVRSYLWSNKTVYEQPSGDCFIPSGTQLGSYTVVGDCYGFRHGFFSAYSSILCSFSSFYVVSEDGSVDKPTFRGTHYDLSSLYIPLYGFPSVSDTLGSDQAAKKFLNGGYDFKPESKIVVSSGLVAGNIADESVSFADGYATWAAGTVAVPGTVVGSDTDDEIAYVPVSIGQTYTETVSQTQEEVQTGDATYVDTSESATTGLLGNVISWLETIWKAICAVPGSIVDAITIVGTGVTSLVDFFTGTAYVESPLVAVNFGNLFDLFPFNIPYGIYQAINFWNSSAEAPTIVIPLTTFDGSGVDVFEYEINLSDIPGMDELAAIIRAGELILFCVGLLMITRKVTKW